MHLIGSLDLAMFWSSTNGVYSLALCSEQYFPSIQVCLSLSRHHLQYYCNVLPFFGLGTVSKLLDPLAIRLVRRIRHLYTENRVTIMVNASSFRLVGVKLMTACYLSDERCDDRTAGSSSFATEINICPDPD